MKNNYKTEIKKAINDLKSKKTFYKQIPNLLTLSRIVGPFIVVPLALTGNLIGAISIAIPLALTDLVDGKIARKLEITSDLGKELDPLSDKVFAIGLAIPLILSNPLLLINIALEGLIGITNLVAKIKGKNPKTALIGKFKTAFLSLNIIIGYLNLFLQINFGLTVASIIATTILQVSSEITYVNRNFINKKDFVTPNNTLLNNKNNSNNENSNEQVKTLEFQTINNYDNIEIKNSPKVKKITLKYK